MGALELCGGSGLSHGAAMTRVSDAARRPAPSLLRGTGLQSAAPPWPLAAAMRAGECAASPPRATLCASATLRGPPPSSAGSLHEPGPQERRNVRALVQGAEAGMAETSDSSVCPGCGVDMQSEDESAPGYYIRPRALGSGAASALGEEAEDDGEGLESEEDIEGGEGAEGESGWVEFDLRKGESRPVPEGMKGMLLADDDAEDVESALPLEDEDEDWGQDGADAELSEDDEEALLAWEQLWEVEERRDRGKGAKKGAGEPGPAPERLVVCARCHALRHYGRVKDEGAENLLPDFDFDRVVGQRLRTAYGRRAVALLVVDAADFDGSFPRAAARILAEAEAQLAEQWKTGQPGNVFRLVIAVNKCDLLPRQVSWARLEQWIRRRAKAGGAPRVSAVALVSAQTRWGVPALVELLQKMAGPRGDIWVLGAQNAGKSSLINALAHVASAGRQSAQLTEAAVLGTTVGVVALEGLLGARTRVMDTPGLLHPQQITTRLSREEQALVQPRKHLKPRTFRLGEGQTVLIGGLAQVDVVSSPAQSLYLTVWASAYLICHLGKTEKASSILERHLGDRLQPPSGEESTLLQGRWLPREIEVEGDQWDRSSTDVSIAGLGWVAVGVRGKARLRVWTYEGVAVAVRDAMVFDLAKNFERPGFSVALPSSSGKGKGKTGRGEDSAGQALAADRKSAVTAQSKRSA